MLEAIAKRHSIRKFKNQVVEDEKIEALLKAAMQAPTARNKQTWRFIVVQNKQALAEMITLQPHTTMMKGASCAILVLGDQSVNELEGYLYVDGAAAIQNILLEAVNLNLGACWCAIGPLQERIDNFRRYYQIEDHLLPIAAIAIGYPNEEKTFEDRYDPNKVRWVKE